jgi:hypothetical protein
MFDFSALDPTAETPSPIRAMAIDTHLAPGLHDLPSRLRSDMPDTMRNDTTFSLAASTMNRGRELGLVSAQSALALANAVLDAPMPLLAPEEIFPAEDGLAGAAKSFPELAGATPLWFYVLREAELRAGGRKLGPLGGRIVMEAVHAAIDADGDSVLRDGWRPSLPRRAEDRYEATDLIAFSTSRQSTS